MPASVDPFVGRCIGGEFDIQRLIAAGGVGSVYEAVQRSTGKLRAVKLMHAWLVPDDKMRNRFIHEARIAGSVESDHVVEVVSAGIDAELGVPWIAMELLRGQTLGDYAERVGALPRADCLEVLTQARHGLQMAHNRKLVHRDLKPDNIFVADARRLGVPFTIKVLDFGIAKWVQDVREGDQNSQVIGTPSWMAPEQLSNVTNITPATDVWAIGLLAFWMLTGREYWLAANDEQSTVSAMLLELVAGPRSSASARAAELGALVRLPKGFDAWFARCIDTDPLRRFPDAESCIEAVSPLLRAERTPGAGTSDSAAIRSVALPSTTELDMAFAHLSVAEDAGSAHARAHAETAALDSVASEAPSRPARAPTGARPTARRLEPDEIHGALWAGSAEARAFRPLAELLAIGLSRGPSRQPDQRVARAESGGSRPVETRPFPDRVQEAVRHVCLVLGVKPPPALRRAERAGAAVTIESIAPPALGFPPELLEERSTERLRAHAAIGVARTLPTFAVHGLLGSAEALESARKAAVALARGTISGSPYYRPLVSNLGPRRAELQSACALAEAASALDFWQAAELTIARLAFLCSADAEAALHAAASAGFSSPTEALRTELDRFERAPGYDGYWHRRSV